MTDQMRQTKQKLIAGVELLNQYLGPNMDKMLGCCPVDEVAADRPLRRGRPGNDRHIFKTEISSFFLNTTHMNTGSVFVMWRMDPFTDFFGFLLFKLNPHKKNPLEHGVNFCDVEDLAMTAKLSKLKSND